jgi:hypothetical protein
LMDDDDDDAAEVAGQDAGDEREDVGPGHVISCCQYLSQCV